MENNLPNDIESITEMLNGFKMDEQQIDKIEIGETVATPKVEAPKVVEEVKETPKTEDKTKFEHIPKVISERNELRNKFDESQKRVQELESKLSDYDKIGLLGVEETKQLSKDTYTLEKEKDNADRLSNQMKEDFYKDYPTADEKKAEIEEMLSKNPNLSRDFIYRAIEPEAFVDIGKINQGRKDKYAIGGSNPNNLYKQPDINSMNLSELESEINKLVSN